MTNPKQQLQLDLAGVPHLRGQKGATHSSRYGTEAVLDPVVCPASGMPTRAEALAQPGAYDAPLGVRFELEAWELVSSVTVDGPSGYGPRNPSEGEAA